MGRIKLDLTFCKEYAKNKGYKIDQDFYINAKTKMKFIHNIDDCGFSFLISWDTFRAGHGCPKCAKARSGSSQRLNIDFCKEYAKKQGYILNQNTYKNNLTKMNFIHNIKSCKFSFDMVWGNFYQGSRCPKCAGAIRLTIDFCKKKAMERGYLLLESIYKNNHTNMKFTHNIKNCGFSFYMSWNNFYAGKNCPLCSSKQSESKIATKLKEYFKNNFNAITEFRECINPLTGMYLPYDIYFKFENNNIYVEVQGEQHYSFKNFYGKNLEDFNKQKNRDKVKKKHAKRNGIFIEVDLRKMKSPEMAIEYILDYLD